MMSDPRGSGIAAMSSLDAAAARMSRDERSDGSGSECYQAASNTNAAATAQADDDDEGATTSTEDEDAAAPPSRHTQFLDLTNGTGGSLPKSDSGGGGSKNGNSSSNDDPARSYIMQHAYSTNSDKDVHMEDVATAAATMVSAGNDSAGGGSGNGEVKQRRRYQRKRQQLPKHHRSANNSSGDEQRVGLSVSIASSTTGGNAREQPYHSSNPNFDPSTPGKVVDNGNEHTGRWTQEEHDNFLAALKIYGKEWKKVAAKVKTRTVVQTRTHAQKYYQKLQKAMDHAKTSGEEVTSVQMGTAGAVSPSAALMASVGDSSSTAPSSKRAKKAANVASTMPPTSTGAAAVAALPANTYSPVSIVKNAPAPGMAPTTSSLGIPIIVPSRPTGDAATQHRQSSVASAAQLISNLAGNSSKPSPSRLSSSSDYRSAFSAAKLSSANKTRPPQGSVMSNFGVSIVAPDATASLRRNPFPEPSPAACGKRKLAELAAAKLLVGVSSSGGVGGGFLSMPRKTIPTKQNDETQHRDAILSAEGTATPPPAESATERVAEPPSRSALASAFGPALIQSESNSKSDTSIMRPPSAATTATNMLSMPLPGDSGVSSSPNVTPPRPNKGAEKHDAGSNDRTPGATRPVGSGLSLQIVNPESLGVTYKASRSRMKNGSGDSPVTPWDGQLKALVTESKQKDDDEEHDTSNPFMGAPAMPRMASVDDIDDVMDEGPLAGLDDGMLGSPVHSIVGPAASFGRSRLHKAVCDMDLAAIQIGLSLNSEHLERKDEAGYVPLHSAAALYLKYRREQEQHGITDVPASTVASDICRVLLSAGADSSSRDKQGNAPLHWACRAGDLHTVELLLENGPRDANNTAGETPLHWAMRAGHRSLQVVKALLENGARPTALSKDFKRPIDLAADGYDDEGMASSAGAVSRPTMNIMELKKLAQKRKRLTKEQRAVLVQAAVSRKATRANLFQASKNSRTLVLHHPDCLEHIPKASSDWECPGRVTTILNRVLQNSFTKDGTSMGIQPHEICISQEFDKAKVDLLRRVHSTEYLSFVNNLSAELDKQATQQRMSQQQQNRGNGSDEESFGDTRSMTPPVVPFTPMVQKSMTRMSESRVKLGQHSDTSFSGGSLNAARRAAGAVQHAVDCVLVGRNRNAFCIVRPPGHHAGINGLLDGGESCGFCIFNNVAAGAMHAISDEKLLCERCAIVDFDVHHGNGTEEIVRKCHDPSKLFFFSIHLYDNQRKGKRETKSFQYKFYPGTGVEDDVAMNIINVPIAPLWKESAPLAQTSTRSSHNTRQKTRQRSLDVSSSNNADGDESSDGGTPRTSDIESVANENNNSRSGTTSPAPPAGVNLTSGRLAYRNAIQSRLLPSLRAFNPDLILISAGFDAAKDDVGNAKHEANKEKRGMDLEPEDYAWTTRKILEIADICCQGRVVSVLEGGYGRTPPPQRQAGNEGDDALDRSVLGECALRHLHAMIDPYDAERRFPSSS